MHQKANLLKFVLISLLVITACQTAFAQSKGYILIGDSTYKEGYIIFKNNKPDEVFFQETKKSLPVYYTAQQLSGMGYENGNRYKSLDLSVKGKTQHIFLKELAKGKLNLYFLRDDNAVYLLKNDEPIRLTKANYRQELQPYMQACPKISWQFRRVHFTNPSLIAFGKSINSGSCTSLPTGSLGIAIAANSSSLTLNDEAFPDNYAGSFSMPSQNLSAGIYIERMLWGKGNFNYTGQVTYQKMSFGQAVSGANYDQQIKADLELLRLSLQPKYYKHLKHVSLFAEFGPEALYILHQPSKMIQSHRKPNRANIDVQLAYKDDFLDLPPLNFGLTAGGGIKCYYLNRHYVSLGISTSYTFGKNHSFNNLAATLRVNL